MDKKKLSAEEYHCLLVHILGSVDFKALDPETVRCHLDNWLQHHSRWGIQRFLNIDPTCKIVAILPVKTDYRTSLDEQIAQLPVPSKVKVSQIRKNKEFRNIPTDLAVTIFTFYGLKSPELFELSLKNMQHRPANFQELLALGRGYVQEPPKSLVRHEIMALGTEITGGVEGRSCSPVIIFPFDTLKGSLEARTRQPYTGMQSRYVLAVHQPD